jgi:hypothetical protein
MKLLLLLAAIYSLIIHQSNKNAKEKEMAEKKSITKGILLQINSYKKPVALPNFTYGTAGFVSSSKNSNIYAKWENRE